MFAAKAAKKLTFEQMAQELGRTEVAVAALFYAQAQASAEDVEKLSKLLGLEQAQLAHLTEYPTRGHTIEMPPKEPLMYRLYEIVQNFGPSYKAVLNEKFGKSASTPVKFRPMGPGSRGLPAQEMVSCPPSPSRQTSRRKQMTRACGAK